MESGSGSWTTGGDMNEWGLGDPDWGNVHSGSYCWGTDINASSPGDNDEYENDANEWLRTPNVDLTSTPNARLIFWHKFRTENNYDIAYVEVSVNGGSWTTLESYSTDIGGTNSWIQKVISLNSQAGNNIRVRFRLDSDDGITDKGWYIDDINITCT
jgi:bacillopeptidase F